MELYAQLSDHALAALIRDRDRDAFAALYERYWAILFRYARKMLREDEEAGDIVQDVFIQLWERSAELHPDRNIAGWLYTSMRNRIVTLINRHKRYQDYIASLGEYLEKGECQTDDLLREKEFAVIIEREVEKLPPKMREVFELSRRAHLDHKTIAKTLHISEGTVKKQVANALKILRSRFGMFFFLLVMHVMLAVNRLF